MNKKEEIILEIRVNSKDSLLKIGKHQIALENLKAKQAEFKAELDDGTKKYPAYRKAMDETTAAIKFEQDAIRSLSKEIQNNIKQETAAVGSIDGMKAGLSKLTAQYNALSAEQRTGAAGENLRKEIVAIDAALKAEEQSLGNFRRQVGNYEVATTSLSQELKLLREEMMKLKMEGKDGTAEYQQIAEKTSQIVDAMGDVNRELGVGASDTRGLDTALQSVTALTAGMTALNSIQGLVSEDNKAMQATIQKAQLLMAALSAAIAIQNAFQKESAIIKGVVNLQSWAATKAIAAEASATALATVKQKIFNAVAKAHPYTILAVALATVIGAIWAFASGSETAAEKQKWLCDSIDKTNAELQRMKDLADFNASFAEATGATTAELRKLRYEAAKARRDTADAMYDMALAQGANAETIQKAFDLMNGAQDEFMKIMRANIVAEAKEKGDAKKQAEQDANTAVAAAKERRQKELQEVRAAQDAVFALLKDGQDKEIAEVKIKYDRQIEDLKTKLAEEKNLTEKAKQAIAAQIVAIEDRQAQDVTKINETFSRELFDKQLAEQELFIANRLARAKEGTKAEFNLRMQSIETQMEAELEANSRKIETEQMDEWLIRDKYAAMREQATTDRDKLLADKELERARLGVENELLQVQLDGGNVLQAKLDAKKTEIAAIASLEFASQEERVNRERQLALELQGIETEIQQSKQQQLQDTLTAFGGLAGSLGQIFEQMGEDNEAMAVFSKALALVELGINTAKAISAGVASAAGVAFPGNIIAIASTVAAVVANIAQATQILNKQKTPKAPKVNKYATGGVIEGPGSGTSDSVPAMLSNGESVLTALTTSMFAPILSSFNQIGGGVPIQVVNSSAQVLGEEMLARAFAKGAAMLPPPVVSVQEVTDTQARLAKIEELRRF